MNRVLRNIGQLATCPAEIPQQDAGLISDAALIIEDELIRWVGPQSELPDPGDGYETMDCQGKLVIPGLIDCHTHLCFGGWRGDEFAMRLQGATYQEIAAAGGGIRHTVNATRASSADELAEKAHIALDHMLGLGVTSVECKSGYGLDRNTEIRQLEVYRNLNEEHAIDLFPTYLGAHVVPDEFQDDRQAYVSLICDEVLPEVARRGLAQFCDAFVEAGAFTVEEGRQILGTARELGLGIKLHADQLSDTGAAQLAAEMGAVSAEHLEYASLAGMQSMADSGTVAVSLPLASLYLREEYMPAREFINAGVPVAVATDFNPGSAPSYHLPLAMTLACINQQMTPQEVLKGATSIAAKAISAGNTIGSLTPGYQADIAIMDAPDLNQWLYHFTANACLGVIKNGQPQ